MFDSLKSIQRQFLRIVFFVGIKITALLLMVVVCSGCSKLGHVNELLALKAVADDQARFDKVVEKYDKKFELLVKEVRQDTIKNYPDKRSIFENFGEPINVNTKKRNNQETEFWYYRRAVKFFDSEEVYLYFDDSGRLNDWEYFETEK